MQADHHFLTVCRYVERNAVRANLVAAAEAWPWGSPWQRITRTPAVTLDEWPVPPARDWLELVNRPHTDAELEAVRRAVVRGAPYGDRDWQQRTAKQLSLESTLRPRGRPRKVGVTW